MSQLSADEFNERVRILRRYREALVRQRDRFRDYLLVLEARGAGGDPAEELEFHVELEASIVREISSFERTIEPLETLYRAHDSEGAQEIPALREALVKTRDEVLRRTQGNREVLRDQLDAIRREISSLRVLHTGHHSFAGAAPAGPAVVDVTA
ncbi:MAG: flagellar biosynthesis protein FlgN [Spirochaetota bacterium]